MSAQKKPDELPSPQAFLAMPEIWESIFDSLPDLASVVDQDHRFVKVNQALAQRLGLEPSQAVGRLCYELMHGLEHPPSSCPHAMLMLDGQKHVVDIHEPRLGGHFISSCAPLFDGAGRLLGSVHLWRDVSDRRNAEAALEWELTLNSALARLGQELLASSLSLGVVAHTVLDFAQGLTRSRRGMVTVLDPVSGQKVNHTSADGNPSPFFPGPNAGAPRGIWGNALVSGEAFFTNHPAGHPSAQDDPAAAAALGAFLAMPVAIGDEVVGQIALCDPAKPYQAQDLRAVERLARLFALAVQRLRGEAERDRLGAQLRHSQKMEALGVLAGGIAHDFNNILGSLFGFTEMALSEAQQGNPAEADLRNVLLACQRARDLVSRLLSFSRPGLERRQPLKLRSLINETVKLMRATLPSTIDLQASLCDEQGCALADPTQIHQVLMNLITNASQALDPRGSGVINVILQDIGPEQAELARLHGLEPGHFTRLLVRDNGLGMDQATQERIFEPFFTTKRGSGSGLGLSVVHGIVQAHGGGLQVTSVPGQGSSFSVLIPKAPPREEGQPEPGPSALPRGQERVLVVDDEPPLLEVVSRMLGKLGYQVDAFSNSRQALAAFQSRPGDFDLLLTDQTMPGLTGEELTRAALALRPDLPVIICTGFSESLNQERAREVGARLLLMKPLTRQQLAQGMREALQPRA
jgi:PAS domain S-box-containing protein